MGGLKYFFLLLAFLLSGINAANLRFPSVDDIQELISAEKFAEAFILPLTIKEQRAVVSPAIESILTPEKDVTFHLFTRSNPEKGYVLKVGDSMRLQESPLRSSQVLKIIIHGWTDKGTTKWLHVVRKNYLFIDDYNVVIVNWYPMSTVQYPIAAKLTEQVGAYVAELLNFLEAESNITLANVHVLGHSLGAQIAGFAGAKLSGELGRITGLDPARPGFETPIYRDHKGRLDQSDAIFVDVIHTCAGTLGFVNAVGHADFYPNGGTARQPGCSPLISQYCSHGRAHEYMADSIIYPHGFVATKCGSWAEYKAGECSDNSTNVMGEGIDKEMRGTFFLETNSDPPYGKAVTGLVIDIPNRISPGKRFRL